MHQAADRVLKRKEKTMKKRVRKITAMLLAVSMVLGVSGCGKSQKSTQDSGETAKVKIAYQYGLAYAPLTIMQEQGLIEKNYDGDIEVEWVSLNSGSAINEGMASGDIDVACMGIAPFITGVTAGIPYKMYGTIAAQPNELLTNEDTIHSLKDITDDKKISVVNVGSIQHILLAMLAKQELGDAPCTGQQSGDHVPSGWHDCPDVRKCSLPAHNSTLYFQGKRTGQHQRGRKPGFGMAGRQCIYRWSGIR